MSHSWKRYAAYTILAASLTGTDANGQQNPLVRVETFNQKLRLELDQNAQVTRNEFNSALRTWYPPSLLQVLQLDPSLMSNEKFMESYPRLSEYLKEHPEIMRNPTYFLGRPEDEYQYLQNSRSNVAHRVVEQIMIGTVVLALIGMATWLIRAVVDHRRWLRLSKLQTEAQTRLMDRFASNDDLMAFIQTPAGRRFLDSSAVPIEPRAIGAPIGRIMWSVQVGLVLFTGGVGMEIVSAQRIDDLYEGFYVSGVLAMAVGVGFMFSGVASYILSRRFGLLEPGSTNSFTGTGITQGPST
jgi:hypothetical protein